jgi:nitroimidazol reductase NimA-like FMN-containing flavoprotein (pyridoxamine 5'-phosphate oxidase superfamily)
MASPRMSEAEIWAFVVDAPTGILTTLRRDGAPVALPLWFVCLDRTVYVQTRGKKLQRIAHDPRASFLVETGHRWADLKAVHFTGTAEIVDVDAELERGVRAEMDRKYAALRATGTEMPAETSTYYQTVRMATVRFTPDSRILNWDNSKLGRPLT